MSVSGWADLYAWHVDRSSDVPLFALQGLDDGDRTIYVGTLNKVLFPGLRIGYAVVPRQALTAFVNARFLMDRQPPTLYQTVAAEFMREGYFVGHIRRMRLMYREQRDALAAARLARIIERAPRRSTR